MRLLFVSHSFAPEEAPLSNVGGMQRVAMELYDHLEASSDVEAQALVLRASWRMIVPKAIPFLTSMVFRLPRIVKRERIDVVLFSSITSALPLLLTAGALKRQGCVVASIAHGLDVTEKNPIYQACVRRILARLDAVLPVSRATGKVCSDRGMPAERIHVLPNGIALDRFEGTPDETAARGLEPLPSDAFLLVSVGRQVARKGFRWFIEHVMPKLPDRAHYLLAGTGPETPAIEAAIAEHGLAHRVRCLGLVPEETLRALYARGDLFVMPNVNIPGDMEGFGIVMLEAGLCGLPTIAADMEGIRDVIDEGVSGFFCPSGDAEAFVSRIRTLMDTPDSLQVLRTQTRHRIHATFGWEGVAARYISTLETVRRGAPDAQAS